MKTILLADDSNTIRNVLKTVLLEEFTLLEAPDGEEALALAQKEKVDFFILDVNMPKMDGITLTRNLRGLPQYSRIPIIILTTESRDEKKKQGKEAGANGWIVKPCDPEKLLGVIKKLI